MARGPLHIAVVGATGAVGREMLTVLEERETPVKAVSVFASPASEGDTIPFRGSTLKLKRWSGEAFRGIDVVLGATSAAVAREYVPLAVERGALVIDNSSAFRMERDVPLVVPEVNAQEVSHWKQRRIIANPNCSTIQMVVGIEPIRRAAGLRRVVVSTYQSVSGTGQKGMEALSQEVLALYRKSHISQEVPDDTPEDFEESNRFEHSPYPHQIAFNGIPQVGDFRPDGMTSEEAKLIDETRKILGMPALRVSATCVRVPWFACHALSVNLELESALSAAEARSLLEKAPGVILRDDPRENAYPLPFDLAGSDEVYVGRVRRDPSLEHGLNLWIVADNLRKGAALNAVQILETVLALEP